MRESWFRVSERIMSTSVVCIDTVGSYTATVIIRIQEVTNVRVLPPFSVFPRWSDDVGVVRRGGRECIRAPDTAAEAARVNGAVRARVGRAQLPAAPSAAGRSRPGRAWAGRPSALAARACMWLNVGAPLHAGARQGRRLRAPLSSDLILCGRGVLIALIRSCSLHALNT